MKRRTFVLALPPTLIGVHGLARAQGYPNKPIRYIVPVSAGGGSDMIGRTVTERWGKVLNQTFVVDNQAGGGGVIASQNTARAAADGYTLMQGYVATHGTAPKYANLDKVNPGSVVLSGEMMLRHLGWPEAADLVVKGMDAAISARHVTYDFARLMEGAREVKTSEFADRIIAGM